MKQTNKIDFRSSAARNARNYLQNGADMVALFMTAGTRTVVGIMEAERFYDLIKKQANKVAIEKSADGLRWKGLSVMHVPAGLKQAMAVKLTLDIAARDMPKGSNGTRSEYQEKAVADALNALGYMETRWTRVDNAAQSGEYRPDVIGENGVTVEVKGFGGRLF